MSLGRCIPDMVKRGEIDAGRAKRMQELFDELEAYYRRSMGPDAAAAEASEATLRQLRSEAMLKKRQVRLQAMRQIEAVKDLGRFNGKDRWQAIEALLDDDDRAPYRNGSVEFKRLTVENDAHRQIAEFIERHRRGLTGKPKDEAGLADTVRELHGQDTGNARAKVFAGAIGETFEGLRQRFNAAGGNIRKLDGFALPHRHDPMKVRAGGDTAAAQRAAWVEAVLPELDRAKMIDERTGVPFGDDALRQMLDGVAENIRTNGLTGEPSANPRGAGKLANQRAEHRVLHFKDGDAWLRYDAKYGSGDTPFGAIIGHVSGMARDIAMMERLGPNPDATMRYLTDMVVKERAGSDDQVVGDVAGRSMGRAHAETLYQYMKGASSVPIVPETKVGLGLVRGFAGWRNLITARKLGSATIAATFGDLHTGAAARQAYGLSAVSEANNGIMAHLFSRLPEVELLVGYVRDLVPMVRKDRGLAVELNAGLQDAAHSIRSLARLHGEVSGPGWTQVVTDGALRATLLNRVTEQGKNMAFKDVMRQLGRHRETGWADLPAELRGAMERSGIDSFDWAGIRQAPALLDHEVPYVDPSAVTRNGGTQDRLMGFALRVQAASVQESTPRVRAAMTVGTQPGTLVGEGLRTAGQFKAFAFGLFMKQRRLLAALPPGRKAAYAASFFARAVLIGAAIQQVKELVKGNDPLPMDNLEFWEKSLLQSGGLGIVGDLFGSMQDALYGQKIKGIGGFINGPLTQDIDDATSVASQAIGLGKTRADGTMRPANPGGAAVRALDYLSPASSNWYLRAAWERMIIDHLRSELDPHEQQFEARRQRRLQQNRQGMWWQPGAMAPDRAPDLQNAWNAPPGPAPTTP